MLGYIILLYQYTQQIQPLAATGNKTYISWLYIDSARLKYWRLLFILYVNCMYFYRYTVEVFSVKFLAASKPIEKKKLIYNFTIYFEIAILKGECVTMN